MTLLGVLDISASALVEMLHCLKLSGGLTLFPYPTERAFTSWGSHSVAGPSSLATSLQGNHRSAPAGAVNRGLMLCNQSFHVGRG